MKEAGAEIVARDAVDKLMDYLEGYAKELTDCALDIAKHSGRKKVTMDDMNQRGLSAALHENSHRLG
jgi:histone H3/H4